MNIKIFRARWVCLLLTLWVGRLWLPTCWCSAGCALLWMVHRHCSCCPLLPPLLPAAACSFGLWLSILQAIFVVTLLCCCYCWWSLIVWAVVLCHVIVIMVWYPNSLSSSIIIIILSYLTTNHSPSSILMYSYQCRYNKTTPTTIIILQLQSQSKVSLFAFDFDSLGWATVTAHVLVVIVIGWCWCSAGCALLWMVGLLLLLTTDLKKGYQGLITGLYPG